jgi:hypothetical protein
MTEAEWLACDSAESMLELLRREEGSDRKYRLFACACCRRVWDAFPDPRNRDLVAAVEDYPDYGFGDREIYDPAVASSAGEHEHGANPVYWVAKYLGRGFYKMSAAASAAVVLSKVLVVADSESDRRAEARALADLLREVFGNPFRPAAFAPEWRTDTAVTLARQMYEARDFSAMPILADALQDAGCDCEAVLNHCRDTAQPHTRGCWVVDLVLGKS